MLVTQLPIISIDSKTAALLCWGRSSLLISLFVFVTTFLFVKTGAESLLVPELLAWFSLFLEPHVRQTTSIRGPPVRPNSLLHWVVH